MTRRTSSDHASKVKRVINEYDLEGLGDELERRWTATGDDHWSLRKLETWFNSRLLESAIRKCDGRTLGGTLESTYHTLADEDVDPAARTETKRQLQRIGVDVDRLTSDFVSHRAIHTYLTSVRGVSSPDQSLVTPEKAQQAINRLQSKTAAVTESNVNRLVSAGELSVGETETIVTVEVFCNDCGSSFRFGELVERGGCNCQQTTSGP
jgi:hypothetical protein